LLNHSLAIIYIGENKDTQIQSSLIILDTTFHRASASIVDPNRLEVAGEQDPAHELQAGDAALPYYHPY
jgi:hypothetical protein